MSDTVPVTLRLVRWTVTSGSNVNSRAAVVLRAAHRDWQAAAEGNGAVDALLRAVNLALADVLGGEPALVGYDVHALAEGPAAEGRVTVQIGPPTGAAEARAAGRYMGEVASTNVVAASLEVYIAALNAMLSEGAWASAAEEAGAKRGEPDGDEEQSGAEYLHGRTIDTTAWFNH